MAGAIQDGSPTSGIAGASMQEFFGSP